MEHKHIFEECGEWFFWSECGVDQYGPYKTYDEAEEEFFAYCEYIEGNEE